MIGERMGTGTTLLTAREREDAMRTKTPAGKKLVDHANDLVEQAAPRVEAARDRFVNDYLPVAQVALADAGHTAREVAKDAREAAVKAEKSTRRNRRRAAKHAKAKARELAAAAAATPAAVALAEKAHPGSKDKPSRTKRALVLLGLLGIGAAIVKRLRGSSSPVYTPPAQPSPRPTPVADPLTTSSAPPGSSDQGLAVDPDAPGGESADKGGSFFDDAIADSEDQPHRSSTPDQPADRVDVSDVPDPRT